MKSTSPLLLGAALGLLLSLAPSCGKPKEVCSSTNCSGCCDSTGMCQLGADNNFCGTFGNVCQACSSGTSCRQGLCLVSGGGGGGGSTTGGGGGSTTGGGGGSTTGGGGGSTTGGGGGSTTGGGGGSTTGGGGGSTTGGGGGSTTGGGGGSTTGGGGGAMTGGGGGSLPPFTSQLWYYGRVSSTTRNEVGRVFFPSQTVQPFALPGNDIKSWDVNATGRQLAFAADNAVTGRFDVLVINHDGTGLRTVAIPPTGSVSYLRFSPNGQRILFETRDASNFNRLYVVNTAGGAATDITPQGANLTDPNLSIIHTAFSRDSRYVSIVVEATYDRLNELYVVDLSTQPYTPVPKVTAATIGAPGTTSFWGVNVPVQWSASSRNEMVFKLRTTVDTGCPTACPFRLMRMTPAATTWSVVPGTPDGINVMGWVGSFGLAPNGLDLAYSADGLVTNVYEIYTTSLATGAAPTRVTSGTLTFGRPDFLRPLTFDPSGAFLVFGASWSTSTNTTYEPYSLLLPTGPQVRLTPFVLNGVIDEVVFSPTSETALVADWRTDETYELITLATSVANTPTALVTPIAGGDVLDARWTP